MSSLTHGVIAKQRLFSWFLLPALLSALAGCQQPPAEVEQVKIEPAFAALTGQSGSLSNFGEPHLARLSGRLAAGTEVTHVVQLGDSHTAADFFTDALREAFQARFGNAGPGWLPPARIPGQRSATLKLAEINANAWRLTTSRLQQDANFPLGGFVLQPLRSGAVIGLAHHNGEQPVLGWQALYLSHYPVPVLANGRALTWPAGRDWQWSVRQTNALPLSLTTLDQEAPRLGGWLLDNGQPGVMLSALGMNGATIRMPGKWGRQWSQTLAALEPDLLILAYGTNEAFDDDLDVQGFRAELTALAETLRADHPQAVLLLLGAPDVYKYADRGECVARRPEKLASVQRIQQQVARQQQVLFWDWQAMMGGRCSFESWQDKGWAQKDGVHFSRIGYEKAAAALFADLSGILP